LLLLSPVAGPGDRLCIRNVLFVRNPGATSQQLPKLGLRRMLTFAGFARLLAGRLAAQWGDGAFQAALAGAVLFNPERAANPVAIAASFAVLLLPYSVVGPFAGALLDRWDRRSVLLVANCLRGALILLTAAAVGYGLTGPALYTGALLAVGVSRFTAAGLSAALPHVVRPGYLIEANALSVTAGAVTAVLGAASALGLRELSGAGNAGSAWVAASSVLGSIVAAAVISRFAAGVLGPDEVDEPRRTVVAIARGLRDGARAAARVPTVAAAFLALLAHRAAFGVALLLTVLMMRYSFTDTGPFQAGAAGLGEVTLAGGTGLLLGGVCTAPLLHRLGPRLTISASLVLGAVALATLGLPMRLPTTLAAALLLTFAGQTVKLCVDTIVQRDIPDEFRGRVFSLYDTLFNLTQVLAVAVTAPVVAPDGRSPELLLVAVLVYLLGLAGYLLTLRRSTLTAAPAR
jgi:MFS family permease